ncbi:hypothetical protein AUG19_05495 [archaeon 13_1_20CM_2_54_9]|nr:MAG: hypothetical protein AUJ07_08240 [Crenarchaeota archaeon 13_1_40CM_3_53_5]OLE75355.1 MAG: hypothetical protein AUG19_05495 [archaeon 13_1_20CM_2_54_9]
MQTNTNFPTYVFATVNPGRVQNVVEELKRNSQIDLIAPITGRYDLALRLKTSAPEEVYQTVNNIRAISDIRTTTTHTAMDGIQLSKGLESNMALGISLLGVEHSPLGNSIKQLSNIPGLVEAFSVPGQFDIVALWQGKNSAEIMKTSIEKLTTVGGLFHSETLLGYAPYFTA